MILNRIFWSLTLGGLFLFLITGGCDQKGTTGYTLVWENDKPVSVIINQSLDPDEVRISLSNQKQPILGTWKHLNRGSQFTPIVSFTPGLSYTLYRGTDSLYTFTPMSGGLVSPALVNIYPTADTVPENLLKMYFEFSQPMMEGNALENLFVIEMNTGDTLVGTFLDLQPELWNEDNTILTLWLDPGRIKRGLIPNQELGAPLEKNKSYRLIVSSGWKGANGEDLGSNYNRDFTAVERDEQNPDPEKWDIVLPTSGSLDPISVHFVSTMDAILAQEAIHIIHPISGEVPGKIKLMHHETGIGFVPDRTWEKGEYILRVEARLEDLAGNNLNRLFDENISNDQVKKRTIQYYDINFILE